MNENQNVTPEAAQDKRTAILEALARAGVDTPPEDSAGLPDENTNVYYTLTREEVAALVNGNMDKIESWVSSLDRNHSTWLLRWLIKENSNIENHSV